MHCCIFLKNSITAAINSFGLCRVHHPPKPSLWLTLSFRLSNQRFVHSFVRIRSLRHNGGYQQFRFMSGSSPAKTFTLAYAFFLMVLETAFKRKSTKTSAIAIIKYLFKNPVIIIAIIAHAIETDDNVKTAKS